MSSLRARIRDDWQRQPLAILSQGASIIVAIGLAANGSLNSPNAPLGRPVTSATTALAVSILSSSILAMVSQRIFKKSIIAGFLVSVLLASASILLFSLLAQSSLARTTLNEGGTYKGALIDVSFWITFAIFLAICSASAIERVFQTWGNLRSTNDDGTDLGKGVAPFELMLFAAAWGACLGVAQQKILTGFIFEKPPIQQSDAKG